MDEIKLSQKYDAFIEDGFLDIDIDNIPDFIKDNINPEFELREYQINAFMRFLTYLVRKKDEQQIQILFNMATGSGKTLIMVLCILYLYEKGYRNFVFFVDKTNIIKKTIENFLNKESHKYLFNQKIVIDGQEVSIKDVDTFTDASKDSINIHFSTIAGLHSHLNTPKENSISYQDFSKDKTVFISDEAHHINAETRNNPTAAERENISSWEGTVKRLVATHKENILLEFTATIDWTNELIFSKYKDRVIFEYDLKKFREDKYSKDVFLIQSDNDIGDRFIQSIVVSQYRRRIASDHKINLKPVVMMKSKYTNEGVRQREEGLNTSTQNMELFSQVIENISITQIKKNLKYAKQTDENNIIRKAFEYFEERGLSGLISELKVEFSRDRLVDVSDDSKIEENQILINSLEDPRNAVRVVFAVDKLNEGWDVLNLFDIVRLYGTRDTGKATISEAQLVGRGARYNPFTYETFDDKYRRKFDGHENHQLRVIEQLHFHSQQNHRYIDELRQALIKSGIHKQSGREIKLSVKDSFKKSRLYKKGFIWKNKRIINKRESTSSLADYKVLKLYPVTLDHGGSISTESAFEIRERNVNISSNKTLKTVPDISYHVIRKALDKSPFYYYQNLKTYFPSLESIDEFITSKNYLASITLEVETNNSEFKDKDLLGKIVQTLELIKNTIKSNFSEFRGSPDFEAVPVKEIVSDRIMYIEKPEELSEREFGISMSTEQTEIPLDLNTLQCDFYAYNDDYGTSEEKYLVKMIYDQQEKISKGFDEMFLIRNQKIMELFDFDEGRRFEPDYILFLGKGSKETEYLQIFIEPKGSHIEDGDRWKEDFLKKIGDEKEIKNLFEDDNYIIYGLPFYQEAKKLEFIEKLEEIIM